MSIRHLDSLFDPRSVAVIGASDRPASVGATVWRNVRSGGLAGPCWAVNANHAQVGGEPAYRSVASLPEAPDLAVICTPADTVAGLIGELGERGTRAAVVLTAGLGAARKKAMLEVARRHLLRVLGPNCLGLLAPHAGLNASFSHVGARPGTLAFVSQSGALVTAVLDWAQGRGIGFSHCVSLGEHADVDFGDMLDWLASDARTRAILLYIESIESARKFMSARPRRPRTPGRWRGRTSSTTPPSAAPACCAWTRCRTCSTPPRRCRTSAVHTPTPAPPMRRGASA